MLLPGSALKGYAIEASDGRVGTVSDFLFDDTTWKLRWLVDTGYGTRRPSPASTTISSNCRFT